MHSHLHFLVLLDQDIGAFESVDVLLAFAEVRRIRRNLGLPGACCMDRAEGEISPFPPA